MTKLTTNETSSSTSFTFASASFAFSSSLPTGASSDVCSHQLAFDIVRLLIVAHCVTFHEVLAIGEVVPVREEVLTAVILDSETEAFGVIEELACPCLAHC